MSQFKYTLPSGATFTMEAPDGTTQSEADFIFYSQVASGSLVGFVPGQSISGSQQAVVKFALSRLDRGTAGVDDLVILSIVNGLPVISGIPNLIDIPLENPIDQADFVNVAFSPAAIGPINSNQVQGLMAQIANFVDQPADIITQSTGVGIYGFFCEQLEQAGYVKPGTHLRFIANDPVEFIDTMNSPGIWTGLNGIYSLEEFLTSLDEQNKAQMKLMQNGYESLTATGVITPPSAPRVVASRGYVYTQSGLQTISQLSASTGITLSSTQGSAFADTPLSSLLSTSLTNVGSLASGALNSVTSGALANISSLTSKLNNTVIGNVGALVANASKFGTDAVTAWAKNAGLGNLTNLQNMNVGSITTALNSLPTSLTSLTSNIQNLDVLGKASQFATNFSNPLTSLSNLGNFNLSSLPSLNTLTTGIPNLTSLTSSIPSLSSLGNFGSLSSLPGLGSLGSLGGLFGGGGDSLVSTTKVAAGFTNTVNRSVVDAAVKRIVGNSKVPLPQFDFASTSLNASADIAAAQNFLQGLKTQGTQFGISGGGFGGFLLG